MKKLVTSLVLSSVLLAHTNAYAQPQDLLDLDNQKRSATIQQQSWLQPVKDIAWSSFSVVVDNPLTSIAATLGAIWAGNWFFNRDNERPRVPAVPLAGIGNMGGQPPHHNLGAQPPHHPANGGAGGEVRGSNPPAGRLEIPEAQAYLTGQEAAALEELLQAMAAPQAIMTNNILHVEFLLPQDFAATRRREGTTARVHFDEANYTVIRVLRPTPEYLEVFDTDPRRFMLLAVNADPLSFLTGITGITGTTTEETTLNEGEVLRTRFAFTISQPGITLDVLHPRLRIYAQQYDQ